ncbi:MAG: hypothetical protein IPG58_20905, partial [Acidobacteria bacterium]|nr:hypothetical protein [Acidobacteriota bacterium]
RYCFVNPQGHQVHPDAWAIQAAVAITQNGPVTLTFTDLPGQVLPDSTALTREPSEPTNRQTTINDFPAPARQDRIMSNRAARWAARSHRRCSAPSGRLDANGVWSLHIRIDSGSNAPQVINGGGVQGGWGLQLCLQLRPGLRCQAGC